jgi:hypothetical protein
LGAQNLSVPQYPLTKSHCVLADQFIACGKSSDMAHDLASHIWLAVLDTLEENEHTFRLLKSLSQEDDVSYIIQKFVFLSHNNYIYKTTLRDTERFHKYKNKHMYVSIYMERERERGFSPLLRR